MVYGGQPFGTDNSYCENWAANLDQQRANLENSPIDAILSHDEFNRQIEEYNRECAY